MIKKKAAQTPAAKTPVAKKKAAKKPAAKKSTTKKTAKKKPAAKKSTSKTAKSKQAARINVNADNIEHADLGGAKADAADLQADRTDAQGDDAQLQVQDQPNAQTPTDTVNLPIAEQLQPASSAPRALTVAGLSGVSGLGLMLLIKRIFFH